jgi:hypothetical protein
MRGASRVEEAASQETAPVRQLRCLLTFLVPVFGLAALAYAFGPLLPGFRLFAHLPFVSNSAVKVVLMGLLCLYAAGDIERRRALVLVFIAGHILSVAAMLVVLAFADTARTVVLFGNEAAVRDVLWGAVVLDSAITLVVLVFHLHARSGRGEISHAADGRRGSTSNAAERRLRVILVVLGVLFALAAVGYEVGALVPALRDLFVELPFVTNSVVKVGVLAMLCFFVARDVRERLALVEVLVAAHLASALVLFAYAAAAPGGSLPLGSTAVSLHAVLLGALALDALLGVLLLAASLAVWRSRYPARYLRPMEYRALAALAEVVIRGPTAEEEKVPPQEVAGNVDRYISRVRADRRWIYRVALFTLQLHPLLYLKAPLSELDAETRLRHLKRRFQQDAVRRRIPDGVRRILQALIRVAKQLCYAGYYNDPRSFESVGYVPFSKRARTAALKLPERRPHPLAVETPASITLPVLEADVCIVGSGAAGAILAYELARRGRQVLVLECGQYVEPRSFSEAELEMIGKLYADGVFQQTRVRSRSARGTPKAATRSAGTPAAASSVRTSASTATRTSMSAMRASSPRA